MSELRDKNGLTEEEFLRGYNPDKYPKPSATADLCVIARDGAEREILLIRRGGHPFLGQWALPGGFADRNEPLEQTAQRELLEETGIPALPVRLVGVYSAPGRDPRGWVITAAYAAEIEKGAVQAEAGDDAAEAAWFRVSRQGSDILLTSGSETLRITPGIWMAPGGLAFDHRQIIYDALAET